MEGTVYGKRLRPRCSRRNIPFHKDMETLFTSYILKEFDREWNAGEPASPKSEEDDQGGSDEDEEMAEEVDPAEAAPAGHASECSGAGSAIADVAYDADTPIDPRCV
eukprot:3713002-Pyramimonas_sp.AAC.1